VRTLRGPRKKIYCVQKAGNTTDLPNSHKISYQKFFQQEDNTMGLKNLFGWGKGREAAPEASCGSACGAGEKPAEKPAACGASDKPAACGASDKPAACGASDKPAEKPAACGAACGAGDKK
jgi:ACGX-repeat protein